MQPKPRTLKTEPVSSSRLVKVAAFKGRLGARPLYIYLPPGYDQQPDRYYPVLYMHDGQNVFQAFARDSFEGTTWQADLSADALIAAGKMAPIIIVGVANGRERRMAEYLPPYVTLNSRGERRFHGPEIAGLEGRADRTACYYIEDVAGYLRAHYRLLEGPAHTATCGSSMGGLFSAYLAWEFPSFARGHALLSPSFWITRTRRGGLETLARIRRVQKPDLRIWLDSGTLDALGRGDDDKLSTMKARDVLLEKGFVPGPDFHYLLARGATHHESEWAKRLPEILPFLFPPAGGAPVSGASGNGS